MIDMDKNELWNKTKEEILNSNNDELKSALLNQLKPVVVVNNVLVLITSSEQVESWVRKNYMEEIESVIQNIGGEGFSVEIGVDEETGSSSAGQSQDTDAPSQDNNQPDWMQAYNQPEQPTATIPDQNFQQNPQAVYPQNSPQGQVQPQHQQPQRGVIRSTGNEALFSKCTFDSFVVGKSNEFAQGVALAVAEQPGVAYNPLFIYGSSGLGKTHLMIAIANYIAVNYPNMVVCYASANEFLNDYVSATQRNQWNEFNIKYHQVDVLLIDDIQYLEGKEETINQLFRIFNEMTGSNKQIVLSADRSPKDLNMDERLRSRFASGMPADVKAPDFETRLAIIKNCYLRMQQTTNFSGLVPDEVLSYLAETANSNIREMEGAFTRLIGSMTFRHNPDTSITVEEAKEILEDFFPDMAASQVTIATIQSEVERYFKVSHEDLIGSKRSKGITYPRHIAMYLSRYLTDESLESIGKKFGNRDHTTVMYSVGKIDEDQQNNRQLFDQLEQLTTRIRECG